MDGLRPWAELSIAEQLALRESYAKAQEGQPGTCAMDLKIARFAAFLAERGVEFTEDNLKKR